MRRWMAVPMMLLLLLSACGAEKTSAQEPVRLRTSLNEAGGCSFLLELTADYGDYIKNYALRCNCNGDETYFTVTAPEEAAGISAIVSGAAAQVVYEDTVLAIEDFQSRKISPMAAPYLLHQCWCSGYILSIADEEAGQWVEYQLGYGSRQMQVSVRLENGTPTYAEISDGEKVLITCKITDFTLAGKEAGTNETTEENLGGGQS